MCARVRAFSILVALALVVTGAQCVTACAVADCQSHSNVPPCHKEQHHRTHTAPLACSHDLGTGRTADLNGHISHSDLAIAVSTMAVVVPVPIVAVRYEVRRQDSSPPALSSLSAVVLRI
jgi:hypothetical protein